MTSSSESGLPIANRVTMALVQEVEARWGVNPLYPSTPGDPFVPLVLGAGQVYADPSAGGALVADAYMVYAAPWRHECCRQFALEYLTILGRHPGQVPPSAAHHASAALGVTAAAAPSGRGDAGDGDPSSGSGSDTGGADGGGADGGGRGVGDAEAPSSGSSAPDAPGGDGGGESPGEVEGITAQLLPFLSPAPNAPPGVLEVPLALDGAPVLVRLQSRELRNFCELLLRHRSGPLRFIQRSLGGVGPEPVGPPWMVVAAGEWAALAGLVHPARLAEVSLDTAVASEIEGALAAAGAKDPSKSKGKGRGRPPPLHDVPAGIKAAQAVARAIVDCLAVFGGCPALAGLAATVPPEVLAPGWERGVGTVTAPQAVFELGRAVVRALEAGGPPRKGPGAVLAKEARLALRGATEAILTCVLQRVVATPSATARGDGGACEGGGAGLGSRGDLDALLGTLQLPKHHLDDATTDVLYCTRSGSYMYDLATSRSDQDYVLLVAHRQSHMLSVTRPVERISVTTHKPFGADKAEDVEYSVTDVEAFVTDLVKGNPRNLELLLNTRLVYASQQWTELAALAPALVTRRAVAQYAGFVSDRLWRAKAALDEATEGSDGIVAASKLLYHAYHKLFGLEAVVAGRLPPVALTGEDREFVLRIRNQPETLDLRDLISVARDRAEIAKDPRVQLLPAEVDPAPFLRLLERIRRP